MKPVVTAVLTILLLFPSCADLDPMHDRVDRLERRLSDLEHRVSGPLAAPAFLVIRRDAANVADTLPCEATIHMTDVLQGDAVFSFTWMEEGLPADLPAWQDPSKIDAVRFAWSADCHGDAVFRAEIDGQPDRIVVGASNGPGRINIAVLELREGETAQ